MIKKLPSIETNFSDWYNDVIYKSGLVDQSPVRGSMVIPPYGTALWENIKDILNKKIIETGHKNAIFPLFIPLSFLQKEAEHVEGFAPELAIVTHAGGKKLEDPLVVRPTSETMIHYMFAKWLTSWRDLPIKINQWANVVRWELRPRPFLRTTEFHWQEGHTAHATAAEAEDEAKTMLHVYNDIIKNHLAIPTVPGRKSASERFAGADETFTIECIMQDGKALQMCTSHIISQSFAKAFDMKYQDKEGNLAYPHLTSWGFTTRSIGALVMVHGDEKGLVLPPKVAPTQVVIIPIYKKGVDPITINTVVDSIAQSLHKHEIRVVKDLDEHESPGAKFYRWELKGVPLRIEIGPRDIEQGKAMVADRLGMSKEAIALDDIPAFVNKQLQIIQDALFLKAENKMKSLWQKATKLQEFGPILEKKAGFYQTGWCNNPNCEKKLKEFKASIRCLLDEKIFNTCFACDSDSVTDVLVAKSY